MSDLFPAPLQAARDAVWTLIRSGHVAEALPILDRLAELVGAEHPELAHLRGLAAWKNGDLADAADWLARADANNLTVLNDRAALAAARSDWKSCESAARAALLCDPHNRDARHNLALALTRLIRPAEALDAAEAALALAPGDFDLLCLRAAARLMLCGEEMIVKLEQGLADQPDDIDARLNLANYLLQRQQWHEAMPHLQAALDLDPAHPKVLATLGQAMRMIGLPGAAAVLIRAIEADPQDVRLRNELALALIMLGQRDEASAVLDTALEMDPTVESLWVTLAENQRDQGQLDLARQTVARGMAAAGQGCFMLSQVAASAAVLGEPEAAVEAYRRALADDPWQPAVHTNLIFTLDFVPGATAADMQAERRRWGERFCPEVPIAPHPNRRDPERRLRIGYVSADFRLASAAFAFSAPLLCADPEQVELFLYANNGAWDYRTATFRAAADAWRRVDAMSDRDLAAMIRRDEIDILVDLGGHSNAHRLGVFGMKPAPVQVTGWGHSTGTGVRQIDYLFADPVVVPAAERPLFAERIWDLPCVIGYYAAETAPPVMPAPCLTNGFITFGSLGRVEKVDDSVLALWARVLAAVPDSRLLLKDPRLAHAGERERMVERLQAHGIAGERLLTRGHTPHFDHLAAAADLDIALDPFPQGGGVTTLETLFMGVPIITRTGQVVGGRLGQSILTAIGMHELIAGDADDYVAVAAGLARDRTRLTAYRQRLRPAVTGSGLYGRAYAAHVEAGYRAMWRRYCQLPARL